MRGAGWELLDSWILEACGLISRTKPTQWGGADMVFSPLDWNFLPTREEVAQSLYCLDEVVKELVDCLGISHLFLEALSLHSFHCFGHVRRISTTQSFGYSSRPLRFSNAHIEIIISIKTGLTMKNLMRKCLVQELNCSWEVFSLTKRKLTARQCSSKSDYREDYVPSPHVFLKGLFAANLLNDTSSENTVTDVIFFFTFIYLFKISLHQWVFLIPSGSCICTPDSVWRIRSGHCVELSVHTCSTQQEMVQASAFSLKEMVCLVLLRDTGWVERALGTTQDKKYTAEINCVCSTSK